MFSTIRNLLNGKQARRSNARKAQLNLEAMDERNLASVTVTSVQYISVRGIGTERQINITGDDNANRVEVRHDNVSDQVHVFVEGVDLYPSGIPVVGTLAVTVDLRGGSDNFWFHEEAGDLSYGRVGPIRISANLGDGPDAATLEFGSTSNHLPVTIDNSLNINLDGGNGADSVVAAFGQILGTGRVNYRLDLGAGDPMSLSSQVGSAYQNGDILVGGSSTIVMTGGDSCPDFLKFKMMADDTNFDGNVQLAGTMSVTLDGRTGNDNVTAEGEACFTGSFGLSLYGGEGNDTVYAKFKKLEHGLPGTLEIAVHGDGGNDTLGLSVTSVETPPSGSPVDSLLIDGGLGTDNVYSWSTSATRFSCEGVA